MSNKQRKLGNRVRAAHQKLLDWYNRNRKSNHIYRYFLKHGNPNSIGFERELAETARYAKPGHDALVQRMTEHKEEVKGFRR